VHGSSERDQSIERLLRQTLKTPGRDGVTGACLDAETLAAWTDGGLSGEALESAQLHVADCSRCQDLVGTLARITATVPEPEPVRVSRRWLAWFVPLTAAAAALALWVALPGNDARTALVQQTPTLQSQLQDKVLEPQAREPQPPDRSAQAVGGTRAPEPRAEPEAELRRSARQQPTTTPEAASKDVARNDEAKEKAEAGATAALGRVESDELRKGFTAPAAPPAPAAATAAAPSTLAADSTVRTARSAARAGNAAATEIVSPDPAVRWRIIGAALQHSANGGATWEPVSTGVAAELTAGAAPSATVCWLVGRRGLVLLTTDGRTWRVVTFPEMTDLSAVFTVDAGGNVASVTTGDGRTFVTTDAGATWVSR
jgi:hypothetical protein